MASVKRKRPTSIWRKPAVWILLFLVLAVAALGWGVSPTGAPEHSVKIAKGMGASAIADTLATEGLIRNPQLFLAYCAVSGKSSRLKPGNYKLSGSMSLMEVAGKLTQRAKDDEVDVTLPEGLTAAQVAERLEKAGAIRSGDAFLELVRHPQGKVITRMDTPSAGFEGYLFPDTYRFEKNTAPEAVLQRLLDTFYSRVMDSRVSAIAQSSHTLNEIVTVASLIERETERNDERAKVAGVIYNRIAKGMRLQIDASVLYALGHHKSRVLYEDLKVKSPYNTYLHAGLPPGPIASPGVLSIEAALHPEKHNYLFYVASPAGGHKFTSTEAEHNRAVAEYRAWRKQQGASQ
jgi:UPF0755 protein